jgi:hypothetical protein
VTGAIRGRGAQVPAQRRTHRAPARSRCTR